MGKGSFGPGIWSGVALLLTGCRVMPSEGSPRTSFVFPSPPTSPTLGLHLLDLTGPDAPRRDARVAGVAARPLSPAPTRVSVPASPPTPSPSPTTAPPSLLVSIERPRADEALRNYDSSGGETLTRFGRGFSREFDGLENFGFLRLLDRFHTPPPGALDPLGATRQDPELEERTRFFRARGKQVVISSLRGAFEEANPLGPVVTAAERLPQVGLEVLEAAVETVTGEEEGVDFGELRFRARGGLLTPPSHFLSLHYVFGALKADFFPTEANVRVSRDLGAFRLTLRGGIDYFDPAPSGRVEIVRRVGQEWRLRVTAGTGVGFYTLPVFTAWPGDLGTTENRRGLTAFVERRF